MILGVGVLVERLAGRGG
jgi:hypothetical protein